MSLRAPIAPPVPARPLRTTTASTPATPRRGPRGPILMIGLIAFAFTARTALVANRDSITWDEATHLSHTLHFWGTGDDRAMWDLGTPRLCHLIDALPSAVALRLSGHWPQDTSDLAGAIRALVLSADPLVLRPARGMAIAWGLALLGAVAWGVGRRRGWATGLTAAALVSMVPEVLAHSAIAGSDIPFAATSIFALVLLARYLERPGAGRWTAVALAIGLAWATRHTGLLLVGLAGLAHMMTALWRARQDGPGPILRAAGRSAFASIVLGGIAFLVLWAGDGFGVVTLGELAGKSAHVAIPQRLAGWDVSTLPVPTSLASMARQVRHQGQGHEAYFLGERGEHGWARYFPVAFLLKTPIALLGLGLLAVARFRPRDAWEWLCVAFGGLLWFTLIRGHVDIGVRYALPTYALAAPFLARLFERDALRDRIWGPAALALAVVFAGSSLAAHPRYLSSFNEIGGGPSRGWLYLVDSNLDWGQDLDTVGDTCARLGLAEVTTDIASERRLDRPGLTTFALANRSELVLDDPSTPPNRRIPDDSGHYVTIPTRHLAISASRLMGLYSQNQMDWVRSRRLVDRVGDTVFLFDLDRPADRPFAP